MENSFQKWLNCSAVTSVTTSMVNAIALMAASSGSIETNAETEAGLLCDFRDA